MRLIPHKVPGEIRLVPHLPKNTSGKTDKAVLDEWLAEEIADGVAQRADGRVAGLNS